MRRADLDVRLGRPLPARGRRPVRRGSVLQVGTDRPQVLLLDIEGEVAAERVAHVAGPRFSRRDLVVAYVFNQAVADVQHHEWDGVNCNSTAPPGLAVLIDGWP